MCPTRDRYKKPIFPLGLGYMDFKLYKQIIDECNEYHGKDMTLNLHKDGEPLMHSQIGEMIKYAKDYGMLVHFATNGLLMNKKRTELVDNGLDLLTVSVIDETAMNAIADFMKYKGKDKKPFVQVKLFSSKRLVDKNRTGRITLAGNPNVLFSPATSPIHRWKKVGADSIYTFIGWHNWTDEEERFDREPCTKILYSMAVTWEGLLNPCCLDYRRDMLLGEFPKDTIKSGWDKLQKVLENQKQGNWIKPCTTCNYSQRMDEDETKIKWACSNGN